MPGQNEDVRRLSLYLQSTIPNALFHLNHQGIVTVAQFGVMPGNVDSEKAQKAIGFSAREGAKLVFSPGKYNFSGRLLLTDYINIEAKGALFLLTGKTIGGGFIQIIGANFDDPNPWKIKNIRWSGGTIDCGKIAGENGFACSSCEDVLIENVRIQNGRMLFEKNEPNKGGRGITFHPGSQNCTAFNCHIIDFDIGLDSSSKTRDKKVLSGWRTRNINFTNCLIENCGVCGFAAEQVNKPALTALVTQDITLSGCEFIDCASGIGYKKIGRTYTNTPICGVMNGGFAVGVTIVGCKIRNDSQHKPHSVIRGSFRLSSFDLQVDVDNSDILISARPHEIENFSSSPRIHDYIDGTNVLSGWNQGNVYRIFFIFKSCSALISGHEPAGVNAFHFIRSCRFDITVFRRGGRFNETYVENSFDKTNYSEFVDVHGGTRKSFFHNNQE